MNKQPELRPGIEEALRISRFFSKVFAEAGHLCAVSIHFSAAEGLEVLLCRQGSELKRITLKPGWFDMLYEWLEDKTSPILDSLLEFPKAAEGAPPGLASTEERVVRFRLEQREHRNEGRSFLVPVAMSTRGKLLSSLHPGDHAWPAVNSALRGAGGLLVAAAPEGEQLKAAAAIWSALTGAPYIGDAAEERVRVFSAENPKAQVIVGVAADDPLSALTRLCGYRYPAVELRGVISSAFVRRNCTACAAEADFDRKHLLMLPRALQPEELSGYRIGRGCAACEQRGTRGNVCLISILPAAGGRAAELLRRRASEPEWLAEYYPAGLRPLFYDGLQKACSGELTLDALYETLRGVPEAYVTYLRKNAAAANAGKTLEVAVDFFEAGGASSKPLSGKAAFWVQEAGREEERLGGGSVSDHAPLFRFGPSGRLREKPLLLVVEDDLDQRSILELVFKSAGYQVRLAANGNEALGELKAEVPDLVVTDLMMPEMDGAQLVSYLRENQFYKKIPVMVLTVVSDGEKEYSLLDMGADDYCEKTVQRKILLKRIENLLKRAQPAA